MLDGGFLLSMEVISKGTDRRRAASIIVNRHRSSWSCVQCSMFNVLITWSSVDGDGDG